MNIHSDLEQLAIADLSRLQRQLRTLQLELGILLDNKTKKLKKQFHLITILHQEHQTLQKEVNCLIKGTNSKKNFQKENQLSELQRHYAEIQRLLEVDRKNLSELNNHIKKTEKLVDVLRNAETADILYKDTISKVQKRVVKMENRLDVVNKKCSSVLADSRHLRQFINHMLQDRSSFNDMWKKMIMQFNEGKKYAIELIDQSTLAYDQREELCTKLQILKKRNENDKTVHVQEMREMQRRLDHDAKLQKFYDIKCQKRLNPELEKRELNKKLAKKETIEKQITEYMEIIERMKKLCDEENTACLTKKFIRCGDENFALFNYVNELSHEVEVLNETIIESNDEIEHQKIQLQKKALKEEAEALNSLNEQLEKAQQDKFESMKQVENLNTLQQVLLQGVEDAFKLLRGNEAPILNMLSSSAQLTGHNVRLFAGVIEKQINFILANISKEETRSNKILAKKNRVPKFNIKETVKLKM